MTASPAAVSDSVTAWWTGHGVRAARSGLAASLAVLPQVQVLSDPLLFTKVPRAKVEPDVVEAPGSDPPGDLVAVQLVQPSRDQPVLVGAGPVHPGQPDGVPGGVDDPRAPDGQWRMQ